MGILSGNPKDEPLHYGEVYGLWQSLNGTGMMKSALEVYINHTGDDDLKEFLHDKLQLTKDHMMELIELLKENGIPMPPVPPEVPNANLEDIPPGAESSIQPLQLV